MYLFQITESAKKEYFERNFAWHAITEAKQDLTAGIENATVMFIRPSPDGKSKDRLGTMRTTYNLKVIVYSVDIYECHQLISISICTFSMSLKLSLHFI